MRSVEAKPTVTVKGVRIGEGRPKIIVPIVAGHPAAISTLCAQIRESAADIVEWRVDRFAERDPEKILAQLAVIAGSIGERPLLFTIRTRFEGGESDLKKEAYRDLIADACASGYVDLVDVQYLNPMAQRAIDAAKNAGVRVIASNHDFDGTPRLAEIVHRFDAMEAMGADICKISVMASRPQDVADLLAATARRAESARTPLIGVAMGPLGAISRLAGHVFGSCATFASLGETSAPGQLDVNDVQIGLDLIEKGLERQ